MIIDIHTHAVPVKIADEVAKGIEAATELPLLYPNTVASLKQHMKDSGCDAAAVLGVALEGRQVRTANDWLYKIRDRTLLPFGTIHPDDRDPADEVRRLHEKGFPGIKLHPQIHRYHPDDESWNEVYEEASARQMLVMCHVGGIGPGDDEVFSTPQRILKVARHFPRLHLIAAHLGGLGMLEESEQTLVGHPIWIDTAWPPGVGTLDAKRITVLIRRHGAERVLFGTDFPLVDQEADIRFIQDLPLHAREKEQILGSNAATLLGLAL